MTNTPKAMTVVFFDICDYSNMDLSRQIQSIELLEKGIANCIDNLSRYTIVEGGDSFAINFDNINQAVSFAIDLSKYLNGADKSICIRTGIYTGEAMIRPSINKVNNIYGVGIDYAARLAACCEPHQILISSHSLDNTGPRNNPLMKYVSGEGKYKIKHGSEIDVYNLYSAEESFGVSDLPLKNKIGDSSFLIVVGDRRENPAKTIGDLFVAAPSIDDLCHVLKFDWPSDVLLRGDKIMCWAKHNKQSLIAQRNLFIVGSPKVNIAALMINSKSIFRFKMDDIYKTEIENYYDRFKDSDPNDEEFHCWYGDNQKELSERYPNILSPFIIDDPLSKAACTKTESDTYGFISFASHPISDDPKKYSIFVAGIDLCATLAITGRFFNIDFSKHPFGGVIKITKAGVRNRPWYETPHHGQLAKHGGNGTCWMTPPYDHGLITSKIADDRRSLIERLVSADMNMSMNRIQNLLRKK